LEESDAAKAYHPPARTITTDRIAVAAISWRRSPCAWRSLAAMRRDTDAGRDGVRACNRRVLGFACEFMEAKRSSQSPKTSGSMVDAQLGYFFGVLIFCGFRR